MFRGALALVLEEEAPTRCHLCHHDAVWGLRGVSQLTSDARGWLRLAGRWSRRWCITVGLLTICLLLLVATVALGACCESVGWALLGLGVAGRHGGECGSWARVDALREHGGEQRHACAHC